MPSNYVFRNAKASDAVAKILLFVSKFSRQALVKFGESSVGAVWGGSPKSYYVHAESANMDMFDGRVNGAIVQVDPVVLGRTLRGCSANKKITLTIIRPNRIQVIVSYSDHSARTITHTIPCDMKTKEDYDLMCIDKVEFQICHYNIRSYVQPVHQVRHIIDSFVKLGTPKIYLQSKQDSNTNRIEINAKNEGSIVDVYLSDLVDGRDELYMRDDFEGEIYMNQTKRNTAGVQIDPKKLAFFLSGPIDLKKSRASFDIEHNKCLKITLTHEIAIGEKMYQCLLLLHSLGH